jgi:hypothetical protein
VSLGRATPEQVLTAVRVELALVVKRLIACRNRFYRETGTCRTTWQRSKSEICGSSDRFREGTVEQALSQMIPVVLCCWKLSAASLWYSCLISGKRKKGIAAKIRAFVEVTPGYAPIDFEKAVQWCEAKTGKILAQARENALQTALTCRVVIITGGPGVGKTTFVKTILTILRTEGVKCLLCAPTGRAAKRLSEATGMEGKTIHRLLEVQPATSKFARNESKLPARNGCLRRKFVISFILRLRKEYSPMCSSGHRCLFSRNEDRK